MIRFVGAKDVNEVDLPLTNERLNASTINSANNPITHVFTRWTTWF